MIHDKKLKYIKSEGEFDYYFFYPSIFKLYFDDGKKAQWPSHQKSLSHKIHMLIYLLFGDCRILYMCRKDNVVAYVVFSRGGRIIIRDTSADDIYTIFIWTYPEYRSRGYGKKLVYELLHGVNINYKNAYKTIVSDNTASIKAASANGYRRLYPVKRTGLFHTAYRADDVDNYHLYIYERLSN